MHIGPLTFKLPYGLVRQLILRKTVYKREYYLKVIGGIIGCASLLVLMVVSGYQYGMVLATIMFTVICALAAYMPWHIARRIAKKHRSVINGQTWEFLDDEIIVTNSDNSVTRSPWNIIKRVDRLGAFVLLVTQDGSCSPIPLVELGEQGTMEIINKVASCCGDKKSA